MRPCGKIPLIGYLCLMSTAPTQTHAQKLPQTVEGKLPVAVSAAPVPKKFVEGSPHRFWDKKNGWLFAGVAASRTLDYFSTLNMRRRGRQEVFLTNEVVDNHAGFAAIEAAATGVSIGAAYLFHRYGHHKLERWVSIVHIGAASTGAVRNYCLQTAHLAPGTFR
jgi:hypothetical protein